MKILGMLFYSLLVGLLSAYVFTKLWGWFVIPIFDVPGLTFWYAYGLMITFGLLTMSRKYYEMTVEDYSLMLSIPLMAWGFGAIIHQIIIY